MVIYDVIISRLTPIGGIRSLTATAAITTDCIFEIAGHIALPFAPWCRWPRCSTVTTCC